VEELERERSNNASLQELISLLKTKNNELEEENKELKTAASQTS